MVKNGYESTKKRKKLGKHKKSGGRESNNILLGCTHQQDNDEVTRLSMPEHANNLAHTK